MFTSLKNKLREFVREHRWWTLFLCVSLLVTIGFSFLFRIHPVVDARAYDQIAVNLLAGNGFREDVKRSYLFDTAMLRAGPGYEFFLAGIYALFGHHYEAVWVVQAFLHTFSALLLFFIAKKLFGEKGTWIGMIAALFFAFSPDLIENSAMLMTETLYLFLTIFTVWCFLFVFEKTDSARSLLLGVVMGLAFLTRPPLLLFIPFFLFFFWKQKAWLQGGIFLLSFTVILLPWMIRNYSLFHAVIPTTFIGEYNLWIGNTLRSDGGQISEGFNPVTTFVSEQGLLGLSQKAKEEFFSFLLMHPGRFFELTAVRTVRFFSLIRPMGFWFYATGAVKMSIVFSSLIWISALFMVGFSGLITMWKEKSEKIKYFVLLAATAPLFLLATVVQSRYRFQIYPFLALGVGYMVYEIWKKRETWKQKTVWIPLVLLGIFTMVDIFLSFQTVLERLGR